MKIELKQIIEQLNEAICLEPNFTVAAMFNEDAPIDDSEIIGWTIVEKYEDGTVVPFADFEGFKTIKELIEAYGA